MSFKRRGWLGVLGVMSAIACSAAGGVNCFSSSSSTPPDAGLPSQDSGFDSAPPADAGMDASVVPDSGPTVDAAPAEASVDSAAPVDAGPEGGRVPPSCAPGGPGMTNCGASDGGESCCTSPEVPGGTYYRTYNTGDSLSGPPDGGWTDLADPATVSGFRLDKYLVTVGRFRQFVAAWNNGSGYTPPAGSGIQTFLNGGQGLANSSAPGTYEAGWSTSWNSDVDPTTANLTSCSPFSTWTGAAGNQENLPINCENWYEAYAFCIWDGGFLPSEAEWEYAAAGGSQQRVYPWGSADPGASCLGTGCEYAIYNCLYPSGTSGCTGLANIAPVGTQTLGAGLWGHLDMAGEMTEWNLDVYATYVDPCTDCADLSAASAPKVQRGGSFGNGNVTLLSPYRSAGAQINRLYGDGFRCARTP